MRDTSASVGVFVPAVDAGLLPLLCGLATVLGTNTMIGASTLACVKGMAVAVACFLADCVVLDVSLCDAYLSGSGEAAVVLAVGDAV